MGYSGHSCSRRSLRAPRCSIVWAIPANVALDAHCEHPGVLMFGTRAREKKAGVGGFEPRTSCLQLLCLTTVLCLHGHC